MNLVIMHKMLILHYENDDYEENYQFCCMNLMIMHKMFMLYYENYDCEENLMIMHKLFILQYEMMIMKKMINFVV